MALVTFEMDRVVRRLSLAGNLTDDSGRQYRRRQRPAGYSGPQNRKYALTDVRQ